MDDDKIKQLFQDFQPGLSSDFDFLHKLERNINSVELIRQQMQKSRRRSRLAVIVAAVAGFVTGFLASFIVPNIATIISDIQTSMPDSGSMRVISDFPATIAWMIVGTLSIIMSVNAYDLTQSLASSKDQISNNKNEE